MILVVIAGVSLFVYSMGLHAEEMPDTARPGMNALSAVQTLPPGYSTGYGYSWLKQVKADGAYLSGSRGLGVSVAVVDTGVDLRNPRFAGRLRPGASFVTGPVGGQDDNGHGTFVAGLIAGALDNVYTAGLAPDASIIPVKVLSASGNGTDASVSQGIAWAANQGARVINLSLGATAPLSTGGISTAISKGSLLVVASGNEGASNPNWPARYAKEPWANGQIVAVGAVDSNNKMPSWSNKAGDTAAWYIVAPGVSLISAYYKAGTTGALASGSGTSFAAPLVSAAAADIMSKWSYLSANQVAQILFQTATPLGSATRTRPDPIYGWGLLNVKAALEPVGTLQLPVAGSSKSVKLTATGLTASSVISTKGLSQLTLTSVDDFGRAYSTKAGDLIKEVPASASMLFSAMDTQMTLIESQAGATRLRSAYVSNLRGDGVEPRMAFTHEMAKGLVSLGTAGLAHYFFGITEQLADAPNQSLLANPYLSLTPGASYMASGYKVSDTTSLRVGLLTNKTSDLMLQAANNEPLRASAPRNGVMAELVKLHDHGVLKVGLGSAQEGQGFLGSVGSEGFGVSGANTQHVEAAGTWALTSKTLLAGQVAVGQTQVTGNGGLLSGAQQLVTRSWTASIASRGVFRDHDMLVASLSEPLHVVHGDAQVQLPRVSAETGEISFDNARVSLAAPASYVAALGYSTPVGKTAKLRAELHYQPGLESTVAGVRYNQKF